MKTRPSGNLFARLVIAIGAFAGSVLTHAQATRDNPRAGIDFYLNTYGRVAPEKIPQVYAIFEKVSAAADRSSLVTPQLIIVADDKQASAFTLSDGTIFLSTRALNIIKESGSAEQMDARLAFVIGHELAHLAGNDFWDSDISRALLESSTAKELAAGGFGIVDTTSTRQRRELRADDFGFVYAALAGYAVEGLLESSGANRDFLSFWNEKAGKRTDPNYPNPAQRSELLRLRLGELRESLHYFEFGTRLMHVGRYREAIGLFREFQRQFPGRELFNNLGYCHLKMAVAQLDPDFAQKYWLPMVSDLDSGLTRLSVRSATRSVDRRHWRMPAAARDSLLQAVRFFELAVEKDVAYAPGFANLATAQLLLGMDANESRLQLGGGTHLLQAKLAAQQAARLRPQDPQLQSLQAVIEFETALAEPGGSDSGAHSKQLNFSDSVALYNLAALVGADDAAGWQRIAQGFASMPSAMQTALCRRFAEAKLSQQCAQIRGTAVAPAPRPAPIKLSRDLLDAPISDEESRKHGWRKRNLGPATAYVGDQTSVLAIDDIVTLVTLKNPNLSMESLTACCARPLEKRPAAQGVLWHYGRWVAVVRGDRVAEIWLSN